MKKLYAPTLFQLKMMLKKETNPKKRASLKSRIWSKENPDKVSEHNRKHREVHPLTRKQRRIYLDRWYQKKYGGGIIKHYHTFKMLVRAAEKATKRKIAKR